ncbi:MAG: amidohydrolase family protein [Planctomycetes bacterium]|nr:amidohydrolase family protein [Planctomycetota bacterium]
MRVRCALLAAGCELAPAELVWDAAGRILELRRARRGSGPIADQCVLPGLVDAHTHLQLDQPLANEPAAPRDFVPWASAVMAARRDRSTAAHTAAARDAALARIAEGTTAIGEIDSTGCSPAALRATGIAGRCYQELVGYDLDRAGATRLVRQRRRPGALALAAGLSPHAPYSVSAALFRAAAAASGHLAVHCAETAEEQRFLRDGTGPFADLLRALGRMPRGAVPAGVGAVRWLARLGLLRASTQLVHCQELEPGDVEAIAASGAPVVVCPGTIEWFGRAAPPIADWLRRGVVVALGTDSRASNAAWTMRATLRAAARLWPELSPLRIFALATAAGGRALGRRLGTLQRRGRADLLALPATSDRAGDHLEAFVHGECAVAAVRVGGRRGVGGIPALSVRRNDPTLPS